MCVPITSSKRERAPGTSELEKTLGVACRHLTAVVYATRSFLANEPLLVVRIKSVSKSTVYSKLTIPSCTAAFPMCSLLCGL